jgi:hypothetical protein
MHEEGRLKRRFASGSCSRYEAQMNRNIRLILILPVIISLVSCGTMMALLGDNFRYGMSGKVTSSTSGQAIPNVSVNLKCPGIEKSVYQSRKGRTDENGNYRLVGYWELQDCKLTFAHSDYQPFTMDVGKEHMTASYGLSLTYVVNATLEPRTKVKNDQKQP